MPAERKFFFPWASMVSPSPKSKIFPGVNVCVLLTSPLFKKIDIKNWVLSRWPNTHIQVPCIQNPSQFCCLNIAQTSQPWGPHFLALFKLPNPKANIYVQSLLKFPTWGAHGCSKSPPHPMVPPPPPPSGYSIDRCIKSHTAITSKFKMHWFPFNERMLLSWKVVNRYRLGTLFLYLMRMKPFVAL